MVCHLFVLFCCFVVLSLELVVRSCLALSFSVFKFISTSNETHMVLNDLMSLLFDLFIIRVFFLVFFFFGLSLIEGWQLTPLDVRLLEMSILVVGELLQLQRFV
jgi:hypothetical protein